MPAPSHVAVMSMVIIPQVGAPQPFASSTDPAGSGAQAPSIPATPHERQAPQLAATQQKPLAQKPLAHSPAPPHALPLGLVMVHTPETQVKPAAHWVVPVQVVRHAPLPHTYGEQLAGVTAAHVPVPVQCETGV
jgi:hypothetical protein